MNKLTKSEAIANHRKMWRWIKEETKKRKRKVKKEEYFDEMNIPSEDWPEVECYCCEYDRQKQHNSNRCFCPIEWGVNPYTADDPPCSLGLFGEWWGCPDDDWKSAAELAGKIAELPERREKKQCL